MQLGSILDSAKHKPAVSQSVKFRVVLKNGQAQATHADAEALLVFVDEEAREESIVAAAEYVAKQFKGKSPPPSVESNERALQFLALALRDKSDPAKPFAEGGVDQLRPALVFAVAQHLSDEYEAFVAREFPAAPTDDDRAKMRDEALGK